MRLRRPTRATTGHVPGRHGLAAAFLVALTSGCTHTPLCKAVTDHLWPKRWTKRMLVAPVVLPIWTAAVVGDTVIVVPGMVVDDAAADTKRLLWPQRDWEKEYVYECLKLPLRIGGTPLVFAANYCGHWVCYATPRVPDARPEGEADRELANARELMAQGKFMEVIDRMSALEEHRTGELPFSWRDECRFAGTKLEAALRGGRYDLFCGNWACGPKGRCAARQVRPILAQMRKSPDPWGRWVGVSIEMATENRHEALMAALSDEDPIVRFMILQELLLAPHLREAAVQPANDGPLLHGWHVFFCSAYRPTAGQMQSMLPRLDQIAEADAEPMNRAAATRVADRFRCRLGLR